MPKDEAVRGIVPRPAYHRRIRIEPARGEITALLEDDFHAMRVVLRHAGGRVTAIAPHTHRAPWSTCPGAEAKLIETFMGLPLTDVTARRDKTMNCTHLHDLAVLAAAHAKDQKPLLYEAFATDPVEGCRLLELRRNGQTALQWKELDGVLTEPAEIAGRTLFMLRDWIATLSGEEAEAARLLQWSSIVAHGRTIPAIEQRDARSMPPSCYTFQRTRAAIARRVGEKRDFSDGKRVPLAVFDGMR